MMMTMTMMMMMMMMIMTMIMMMIMSNLHGPSLKDNFTKFEIAAATLFNRTKVHHMPGPKMHLKQGLKGF